MRRSGQESRHHADARRGRMRDERRELSVEPVLRRTGVLWHGYVHRRAHVTILPERTSARDQVGGQSP